MPLLHCLTCSTSFAVGLGRCPHCGGSDWRESDVPSLPPKVEVACRTRGCPAENRTQVVRLPLIGAGLVQIPVIACVGCGQVVSTVTPWPVLLREEGDAMPKITRHGGPTIAGAGGSASPPAPAANDGPERTAQAEVKDGPPTPDGWVTRELTGRRRHTCSCGWDSGMRDGDEADEAAREHLAAEHAEGGEGSSPGSSSSTSTEKPGTKPKPSEDDPPKRARKTGNRSGRARTGSSTARSTGGGRTGRTSASDGE